MTIELFQSHANFLEQLKKETLDSLDFMTLRSIVDLYHKILLDKSLKEVTFKYKGKHPYRYLLDLIVQILNKKYYGEKLGNLLINDTLSTEENLLTFPELIYDALKVKNSTNLKNMTLDINFSKCELPLIALISPSKISIIVDNDNHVAIDKILDFNIQMLLANRRELFRSEYISKTKENDNLSSLEKLYLDFETLVKKSSIFSLISKIEMYFPTYYEANQRAFISLIEEVKKYYADNHTDLIEKIKNEYYSYLSQTTDLTNPFLNIIYPKCDLTSYLKKIIHIFLSLCEKTNNYVLYQETLQLIFKYQEIHEHIRKYINHNLEPLRDECFQDCDILNIKLNYHSIIDSKFSLKESLITHRFPEFGSLASRFNFSSKYVENNDVVNSFILFMKNKSYSNLGLNQIFHQHYLENEDYFQILFIKKFLAFKKDIKTKEKIDFKTR